MTNKNELLATMTNEDVEMTESYMFTLPEGTMEKHTKDILSAGDMRRNLGAKHAFIENGLQEADFDVLSFPDIAQIFAGDMPGRELFVQAIQTAVRLHHVKEVVLSSLQENDAVGVDKKFKSTEEEKKYHFDILERAKAFLQSNFPDLSIRVVYAENQGVAVTFDELGTTDDPYQIDMPEALPEKHDHTKLNACCMDGRLRLANDAYMLEKLGEKDFDVLNFPGIAMILAGDQPGRELFIDAIDRAIRTRGIDEFVLSSHQDCGAAGGSKKFGSREAEKEYHTSILDRARSYLQQRFPDLKVQVVYLEFAGDQVTFNKVASEESEAVSESVA